MLGITSWRRVSRSKRAQNPSYVSQVAKICVPDRSLPGICPAIAVRTSASVSLSNLTKAGTRSRLTTSSSTAFAICSCVSGVGKPWSGGKADLLKPVCHHIPHPPALVLEQASQSCKKDAMARLLLLRHRLRNSDEDIHGQQPDTILVVARKVLKQRDHFLDHNCGWHRFNELCQVVRCLPSNHRRIIVHKCAILCPQSFLRWGSSAGIRDVVEAGCRDF